MGVDCDGDAGAPVAAFGPAPGDGIRQAQQQFFVGAHEFVAQGVAAAVASGELDEPLVVPTDQGVVPLEDQAVRAPICAASSISAFRHAARAASSSLPRSAV